MRGVLHSPTRAEPRAADEIVHLSNMEQAGDLDRIVGEIRVHDDQPITSRTFDPGTYRFCKAAIGRSQEHNDAIIIAEPVTNQLQGSVSAVIVYDNDLGVDLFRHDRENCVYQTRDVASLVVGWKNDRYLHVTPFVERRKPGL